MSRLMRSSWPEYHVGMDTTYSENVNLTKPVSTVRYVMLWSTQGEYLKDDFDEKVLAAWSFLDLSSLLLFMNLFSTSSKSSSISSSIVRICRTIACETKNVEGSGTKTSLVRFTRYAPPPHVHHKLYCYTRISLLPTDTEFYLKLHSNV